MFVHLRKKREIIISAKILRPSPSSHHHLSVNFVAFLGTTAQLGSVCVPCFKSSMVAFRFMSPVVVVVVVVVVSSLSSTFTLPAAAVLLLFLLFFFFLLSSIIK